MSDNKRDKILELAIKLRDMVELGTSEEKKVALHKLQRILAKYDIDESELDSKTVKLHPFNIQKNYVWLFNQIVFTVTDGGGLYKDKYSKKRNLYYVKCNYYQQVEISAMFDFYKKIFDEQYEILKVAFVNKHNLFPNNADEDEGYKELPKEEKERVKQAVRMAETLSDASYRQQIEN